MKIFKTSLVVAYLTVFTSCQDNEKTVEVNNPPSDKQITTGNTTANVTITSTDTGRSYDIGEQVPNNEVCMVNNAYMGKLQMEVPFDGKMYFGCCEMCVERIPQDPAVRVALDPITQKPIDKASAFIVLTGPRGEVAYFENEGSYEEFLKQNEKD